MSFQSKTWIDRQTEHPNRRQITNVNDPTDVKTVDISRSEGTVYSEGSPIGASALNDLESRISDMNTSLIGSAVTVTLLANDWNASTHLITVSVTGVTAASNQEIFGLPATSAANIANNKALQEANLMDAGQAGGQITLYAENVPEDDLSIRVIVRV